jgi:hypothetical protein
MKKIITVMMMVASFSSIAGEGSTTDFLMSANFGYEYGCSDLDASDDKLRHTACKLGESMKMAGISKKQFSKVLDEAADNMNDYNSICK